MVAFVRLAPLVFNNIIGVDSSLRIADCEVDGPYNLPTHEVVSRRLGTQSTTDMGAITAAVAMYLDRRNISTFCV